MLLGRPVVFPIELKKKDVDFTGTKMTQPLVSKLMQIHDGVFGKAAARIEEFQKKYKKKYDKKHKAKKFNFKKGHRVQYRPHISKKAKKKGGILWKPRMSWYLISKVDHKKKKVFLQTREGRTLKASKPFDKIRAFAVSH